MTALHVDKDVSQIFKDLQAVQKQTGLTEEQIALKYFNDQRVFDRLRRDSMTIRKLRIVAEGLQSAYRSDAN